MKQLGSGLVFDHFLYSTTICCIENRSFLVNDQIQDLTPFLPLVPPLASVSFFAVQPFFPPFLPGLISAFFPDLHTRPFLPPIAHVLVTVREVLRVLPAPLELGKSLSLFLTLFPRTGLLPVSHPWIWNEKPAAEQTFFWLGFPHKTPFYAVLRSTDDHLRARCCRDPFMLCDAMVCADQAGAIFYKGLLRADIASCIIRRGPLLATALNTSILSGILDFFFAPVHMSTALKRFFVFVFFLFLVLNTHILISE
ncbi:MAG TPA: hypothetical protein PLR60_07655 [Syntrophorhabdaceae bacterium]|nr:hypothetical protein [Syntrophorhabdaceae bacterium]